MVYDTTYEWKGPNRPWDKFVESGYVQLDQLAEMIETVTGAAIDSRRALDFGCGAGRLSIPLAERCEHVYGLDLAPDVLRKADARAKERNLTNVEWLEADRLADISGAYDLVVSSAVMQHIVPREGERTLEALVRGLRPGGVGAIDVVLRPAQPLRQMLQWTRRSLRSRENTPKRLRGWIYMLSRSYSLNRVGKAMAAAGVSDWHVYFTVTSDPRSYDSALIVFRRD